MLACFCKIYTVLLPVVDYANEDKDDSIHKY